MIIESRLCRKLQDPTMPRIEPRLDEDQIPRCQIGCPYRGAGDSGPNQECNLVLRGPGPGQICEPAVHILVNMATRLADIECGNK